MKNSAESYLTPKNKILKLYSAGFILLAVSAALGITFGSTSISFSEFLQMLTEGFDSPAGNIMLYVRIPRTVAALICGAALATSGAVIQAVLDNKLASPGIIGVNSGAGLAITLCSAAGVLGGWQLSLFSFIGAFAAVILVSVAAKKWGASRSTVILMGVALNSLLGAVSDTVITLIPEVGIISRDFKIGDFSAVTYAKLVPAAIIITASVFVLYTLCNELDVITLGDDNAKSLGLNTSVMRTVFMLLAALLAGAAVSVCGLLSFVGLIVPHAVRRFSGNRSRHLLPLCTLFGAGFVCLCDTLARVVAAPYEIPVGIIMAFLGAPFFVFILIKGKGGHRHA